MMLERYDVIISEGAPDPMLPQVEGDWVRYADAQATIADLQGQLKAQAEEYEQVEQCLDEQISGLNQGNLDYEKKIAALQQRVAQLEGELERMKAIKHDDNTQMERAESDKWDAKDHASTLMQRAIYAEGRVRALLKDGDDKDARIKALIIDNDNYRRKYHALQADHARVLGLVQALPVCDVGKEFEYLNILLGFKIDEPLKALLTYRASLPAQPAQGGA